LRETDLPFGPKKRFGITEFIEFTEFPKAINIWMA